MADSLAAISLAPLLETSGAIKFHAFAAKVALALGLAQLSRAKGIPSHRAIGYVCCGLTMIVAAVSLSIHEVMQGRRFGARDLVDATMN